MSKYSDIHTHRKSVSSDVFNLYALTVTARAEIPQEGLFSVAIHPYDARRAEVSWFDTLAMTARHERCIALGETGIDQRSEYSGSIKQQTAVLEEHVFLSNKLHKPLIIHSVRAIDPVMKILEKARESFVFHGFRAGADDACKIIRRGGYLSIGEKITTDSALRNRMISWPLDRLFIETDDSATDVKEIYRCVASAFQMDVEGLKNIIANNVRKVFNIDV